MKMSSLSGLLILKNSHALSVWTSVESQGVNMDMCILQRKYLTKFPSILKVLFPIINRFFFVLR